MLILVLSFFSCVAVVGAVALWILRDWSRRTRHRMTWLMDDELGE